MSAIAKRCAGCGANVPDRRRAGSKYCSKECKATYRAAYLKTEAGDFGPGGHLLFMQGAQTGTVLAVHTYALRTRVRTARASCSEHLRLLGVLVADESRARRFQSAFESTRIRGSWYAPTPELFTFIQRRCRWAGPRPKAISLDPSLAVEEPIIRHAWEIEDETPEADLIV
jgi:hypothetical protein